MGGELGTRVAQLIEDRPWAGEVVGVDFVPPRRRLRRAEFRRIDPRDRDRLAGVRGRFRPDDRRALRRLRTRVADDAGVGASSAPSCARSRRLSAAARAGKLEYVVLRSGLEVYGPRRHAVSVPDEDVVPEPRRRTAGRCSRSRRLRRASVCAPASRCARCGTRRSSDRTCRARSGDCCDSPLVPVAAFSDPPFSLLHPDDAARRWSLRSTTASTARATSSGRARPRPGRRRASADGCRFPCRPDCGPRVATCRRARRRCDRTACRRADPPRSHRRRQSRGRRQLGLTRLTPTQDVLRELFEWADVLPIATNREAVA